MNALSSITPSAVLSQLFPSGTVLALRSSTDMLQWTNTVNLGSIPQSGVLDIITGSTMAVMGNMPLICHKNAATELILDFFRQSGLEPASNIESYETEEEAVSLAQNHIRHGNKIAYAYPPPISLGVSNGLLFPVSLYNWLNDKINLSHLVEAEYLPNYRIIPIDSFLADLAGKLALSLEK